MQHSVALPFTLRRSQDVIAKGTITSTTETVHGLLRLDAGRLTIQWRLARQTDRIGSEIRTDEEFEAVRQVVVPLQDVAGASVRRRWWKWRSGPQFVLTATDLRTFEEVSAEGGLRLEHPAQLVLRIRRTDQLAAEEFAAELAMAIAELDPHRAPGLGARDEQPALPHDSTVTSE